MAIDAENLPHLSDFIATYMNEDWTLFGETWQEVAQTFVADSAPGSVRALSEDIHHFLAGSADPEADYRRLYPLGVLPSGWGLSVADWLRGIEAILER